MHRTKDNTRNIQSTNEMLDHWKKIFSFNVMINRNTYLDVLHTRSFKLHITQSAVSTRNEFIVISFHR